MEDKNQTKGAPHITTYLGFVSGLGLPLSVCLHCNYQIKTEKARK